MLFIGTLTQDERFFSIAIWKYMVMIYNSIFKKVADTQKRTATFLNPHP